MADYNVNMKQWNGTSFDNVLPLAYNAKQLGGQSLAEVKQWVQDNGLLLYTGQYTGTGTYGQSNPTSITFPFEPLIFLAPIDSALAQRNGIVTFLTQILETSYTYAYFGVTGNTYAKKNVDGKTIVWYSSDGAYYQLNDLGHIYHFAAIGGYDMGAPTEWTITKSGTWSVPKTGHYMLELYGGGGGARFTNESGSTGYTGGTSCQRYSSVVLTAGDIINVVIGFGGYKGGQHQNAQAGTSTSFGSYSVAGGGAATFTKGGSKAGNLGTDGSSYSNSQYYNYNNGTFREYGSCSSDGTNGAVYLKYLGA